MFLMKMDEKVMRKICFYKLINAHISIYIIYLYLSNHYIYIYNNSYNEIILLSDLYIYYILFCRYILDCHKNAGNSTPANDLIHNLITKPSEISSRKASNMRIKYKSNLHAPIVASGTLVSSVSIKNALIRGHKKANAFLHGFKMSPSELQNQFSNTVKAINNI